ncbi:MAG: hypothetical protein FJZ04_01030 [Candidatus Moranbacteria bacterium]|nr:hypothetical protein [Candidatus Moranbacteria bacterium]
MKEIKNWLFIPAFILIFVGSSYLTYSQVLPFFSAPKIDLEKEILDLEDPLIVKIDRKVVHHKVESSFSIFPSVIGKLNWRGNDLMFTPAQPWKPGEHYRVSFAGITQIVSNFSYNGFFSTEAYPKVQNISPSEESVIGPKTPIEFSFDRGRPNVRYDFQVFPSINYKLSVDEERKKIQLIPENPLMQDVRYQIVAKESYKGKDGKLWYPEQIANFQFKTSPPPKVSKTIPTNNETEVKEFSSLRVYFDKPMRIEDKDYFFKVEPKVLGKFEVEDQDKTIIFKPSKWALNTNYKVIIKSGWSAQDGTFLEEDVVVKFKTFDSGGIVNRTNAATENPYFKEGRYVDINLSKQILSIFSDGTNVGNYRISSGKRGMATPTGTFSILSKRKRAWSKKYGLFMPYWMQFTRAGHGIHELPEWPGGYKEGANHLGIPVSHGCVRLGIGAAETVYGFVEVGTPIYIHY